jgi:hypothetical protein
MHTQYGGRLLAIPARDWEGVTPEQAARHDAISGHYPYGVAEEVWGLDDVRYVTFLRDPVKRVASLYSYIMMRGKGHRAYQQVSKMTVQEFAESGPFDNCMTRMLAGRYDFQWFQNKEPVTEDDLHLATENLGRIWFVGDVATFREDVYRLADLLDWGPFVIPHINASMSKPRIEPTDAFRNKWWADIELYSSWSEQRQK